MDADHPAKGVPFARRSTVLGQHGLPISWMIGTAVVSTIVNAMWSTVQTALYVELRNWKGGYSDEALQDIFA